jgi:CubicO group peptidase (beta-lactamase class C family)
VTPSVSGLTGHGPPSVETQYRIGSVTKTMTAVLVMQLRDEGDLALGDPAGPAPAGPRWLW